MRARAHAAGAEPKKDYSFCSARGIEEEEKKEKLGIQERQRKE